ncbi:unnamed protein product [Pipistrellus nathusii]|uniref:Uncharacterized protein n=1 Tax=Pipistrellus nathusii TaxID=59473 RepID=A0ABN9ZUI8_PIPNA
MAHPEPVNLPPTDDSLPEKVSPNPSPRAWGSSPGSGHSQDVDISWFFLSPSSCLATWDPRELWRVPGPREAMWSQNQQPMPPTLSQIQRTRKWIFTQFK